MDVSLSVLLSDDSDLKAQFLTIVGYFGLPIFHFLILACVCMFVQRRVADTHYYYWLEILTATHIVRRD